ncbi:DUF4202 domain-containing protein [Stappia sp. BW2]|jgi:hypothetical protein|uniref:DUF4202 domain-containing protein n=1 Tax=Stappia sp. BW2 TaxID=2592622 RepID=UPI0011DEB5F3|nr:DUF4202 domain-containing protein [Stappia sp. BW2]TYC79065.1 DUF4202 domain-containing protein [Stappia sp. BW2]
MKLETALKAIDSANAADPNQEGGKPAALLYGQRMSEELDRLYPEASDPLKIAARGQHIERWITPRQSYPEGKTGYHAWRRDQARHHAHRVGEIMAEAAYSPEEIEAAAKMLRKEGLKRDADVQALENVICFVFLKWYFAPFAAKHEDAKVLDIVQKTARKMSEDARERVLAEFELPHQLAEAFRS